MNELPHDFALAIRTNLRSHHKAYQIMDIFHHKGICLSLQKTAYNLRNYLHNSGIDSQKIHIIDPLSKVIGSVLEAENTTHVPYNLNHMIDIIEKTVKQSPLKQRFVMIDGLHVLPLVYNEEKILSFLKTLNNKLKINHANGIYIYDKEKLHPPFTTAVHKIADKVIEMQ